MTENNPRFKLDYLKFAVYVSNDLGIEPIPFDFDKLENEEARLIINDGYEKIIISDKNKDNEIQTMKCIAHEMRHSYQFKCCKENNDPIGLLDKWINDIININDLRNNFIKYKMSSIEIDSNSYESYIINKYYNKNVINLDNTIIGRIYKQYQKKYFD